MVKLLTASAGWSRPPERSPHLPQSAGVPVGPRVSCWLRAVAVVVRTGKHGPLVTSWTGRGEVPRHADPSAEPAAPRLLSATSGAAASWAGVRVQLAEVRGP